MTKLKYRLQEGEKVIRAEDGEGQMSLQELDKKYFVMMAVVREKPTTEKELVKKVKTTVKREDDVVTKLVKKLKKNK